MAEHLDVEIPALLAGVRLDRALCMLAECSRGVAAELISAGLVTVNGRRRPRSHPLVAGDHLVAELPDPVAESVAPDPSVVVEVVSADPDLLVVNKAPELVVHPGAGHLDGTMVAGLLARYPELEALGHLEGADPQRPGIVHRLDRGTSGLLVVARSEAAYRSLVAQLSARLVERRYLAIVHGHLDDDRGVIDAPIGRSPRSPTMMAISRDGREARTGYEVVERFGEEEPRSVVALRLETGRTHQIRVHLAAIGHPVVGDLRYGRRADANLRDGRFALHAYRLGFTHPTTGELVRFEAEVPGDLAGLLPGPLAVDQLP